MDADVSFPHFENPHIRSINEIIYSKDPENTKKPNKFAWQVLVDNVIEQQRHFIA